ncbi:hypothetical protein A5634_15930 [Mycobacterium asiaticum]|uniref:Metallo-beta-lactamase domain-containing protein n=1 Tax=Mycobacterium asiaticum TaxID=1790 RepID=A0A1A3PD84_MYCAS|nr:MBL fold metallo-hydrolase [Mycobacterium asiaticum]OBK30557.1 hypothetical protein A5634_15930 [Mycobacterium asiaticum]
MKVHHLNCGTMNSPGAPLVCHVLLVETEDGLVLVDTGYGMQDCLDPNRIGPFRHVIRPVLQQSETAIRQVEQLGFRPADVRHIVVTHFDFDHIGGISDFPDAFVHVTTDEARGAVHAPSLRERLRYRSVQWAHGPKLVEHAVSGELWRGFAAAKPIIGDGVVLVPMPGHTRGHAAVAVESASHWILHCGDAFYHKGTLNRSRIPFALRAQEELFAFSRTQLHENQNRLAELYGRTDPDLSIICAHDPSLFQQASG